MKTIGSISITALLAVAFAFTLLPPTEWKVAEGYSIRFSGKGTKGSFSDLVAFIFFDENSLASSKISASIRATTVSTGFGLKNDHARSETALNVKQFPLILFESTQIVKTNTGYEALGKLTLRDVSLDVRLPFTFERTGAESALLKGQFVLQPKDYHITRSGTPETVTIELVVPVKK